MQLLVTTWMGDYLQTLLKCIGLQPTT